MIRLFFYHNIADPQQTKSADNIGLILQVATFSSARYDNDNSIL